MAIPERCEGCRDVENIADKPFMGFSGFIEQEFGSPVTQTSWALSEWYGDGRPGAAWLADGRMLNRDTLSDAWFSAEIERDGRQRAITEFTANCPGLCVATAQNEGQPVSVKICGKMVVEAAQTSSE